jgi:diaminopimelate dehydrogenase
MILYRKTNSQPQRTKVTVMNKIRTAIAGFGNVGAMALEAILREPDMEFAGIIDTAPVQNIVSKLNPGRCNCLSPKVPLYKSIKDAGEIDVAIICAPSRKVKEIVSEYLAKGIHTVDSFDIHTEIPQLKKELDAVAKQYNKVSITAAGWDPGINSVMRGWFLAMAPRGVTYTNYGPGMSMGHTVAVKAIEGVKNALSVTVPAGMGIHRRMVYIELEEGYDFKQVEERIKTDPYFIKDKTYVYEVPDVTQLIDMGHGVLMERKGVSGGTHNQMLRFEMRIDNPALTSQVMVSAARAAVKQRPGCYTMIEVPVIDFLYGELEDFIQKIV